MRVLAVLFRLFSLLGVLAFSGMLWLKFDTLNKQSFSYLDEIIDDSYSILQSEQEAKWKDLGEKKSIFNDIFDSNEQVEDGEENKHIEMMSNVATIALEEDIREKWVNATTIEEIINTFN